ncbi:hypothetical protein NIT60_08045 [Mammaliicoccus sciuri]|nr:hypothetical protein NIT60_08045 [Mammaliicoccus sciuri]
MKANVLISGGSGYIGKHLISTLKDIGNLYTITKYESDMMIDDEVTWRKCDIFVLKDMIGSIEKYRYCNLLFRSKQEISKVNTKYCP